MSETTAHEAFFEQEYCIRVSDTDLFGLCRPSALLNDMQECAFRHIEDLGIGVLNLIREHNAVWMLVRMKYDLYRPLRGGEQLRLKTFMFEPQGKFLYRDFELYVGEELIGRACSTWVLGDAEHHALLRAEEILKPYHVKAPPLPHKRLAKIRMPKDMELAGEKRISYSETDINGHANNARYADFACDAIEFETHRGSYLKTIQITYSAECLVGKTMDICRKYENGAFYVRGVDKEGKPHFDIRMELAEI